MTDANGCVDTNTVNVNISSSIDSVTVSAVTYASCAAVCDAEASVTATGGTLPYTYLWSDGDSTQTITDLCIGNYGVIVTDANGCTDSSGIVIQSDPDTVSVNVFSVTGVSCAAACNGGVTVSATGGTSPYTYLWSNGGSAQTIGSLCSGAVGVIVTDSTGCTDSTGAFVGIDSNYVITAGFSVSATSGNIPFEVIFTDTSTGISGWQWDFSYDSLAFNVESTLQDPTYEYTDSGQYAVMLIVTDISTGCTDTASLELLAKSGYILYVPNIFSPGKGSMYYVCGQGVKSIFFVIYDRWGKKIFENDDATRKDNCGTHCCQIGKGWDGKFNGKDLSPQVFVYYIEAELENGKEFKEKGNITLVR